MANPRSTDGVPRSRRALREELAERDARFAELRPYLDLAREIHEEVRRVSADPSAAATALTDAIARVPDQERDRVARAVFDALPAQDQWAIIERAYSDDEIRRLLADERGARLEQVRAADGRANRLRTARDEHRLDAAAVRPGEVVVLGLFRPGEVQQALVRGAASDAAARVLTLRREPDGDRVAGWFRVLTDAFNPGGSYFVTADYDQSVWRSEAIESHSLVRVGAAGDRDGSFTTAVFPGARLDIDIDVGGDGGVRRGRLHVGYASVEGDDVFRPT